MESLLQESKPINEWQQKYKNLVHINSIGNEKHILSYYDVQQSALQYYPFYFSNSGQLDLENELTANIKTTTKIKRILNFSVLPENLILMDNHHLYSFCLPSQNFESLLTNEEIPLDFCSPDFNDHFFCISNSQIRNHSRISIYDAHTFSLKHQVNSEDLENQKLKSGKFSEHPMISIFNTPHKVFTKDFR